MDFVDKLHDNVEHPYVIYSPAIAVEYGICSIELDPQLLDESYCAIIFLNQHFIDDCYKQFTTICAFTKLIENQHFDLLVVLTEPLESLRNIPDFLKCYLRGNIYLDITRDQQWISKLRLWLPNPNRVPINATGDLNFYPRGSVHIRLLKRSPTVDDHLVESMAIDSLE